MSMRPLCLQIKCLLCVALVLSLLAAWPSRWLSRAATSPARLTSARATMSAQVSARAPQDSNPFVHLADGRAVLTAYDGPAELQSAFERNEVKPLALATADFDEDGVPDLVCGYTSAGGGAITLLRGNVDSIYPNAPEAQRRKAVGTFTAAPFLSPARIFPVATTPDFLGAGDFDADGHWDVVAARRGDTALYLLAGDGHGGLRATSKVGL